MTTELKVRLLRLSKGVLLLGIAAAYLLYLLWMLLYVGWQQALFAALALLLVQGLRVVGNEVERIGWRLESQSEKPESEKSTSRLQKQLLALVVLVIQVINVVLVVQAYLLTDVNWTMGLVALFVFIELLFMAIRRINRTVSYDTAVYGGQDSIWFGVDSRSKTNAMDVRMKKLDEKLEMLDKMREEGKISSEAYRRAVDEYRVAEAMKDS